MVARWSCGGAVELRWRGGVEVARWSCGGAVELRWLAATPGLAAAAAGGGEGAGGLGNGSARPAFYGQWTMLYIGAAAKDPFFTSENKVIPLKLGSTSVVI